MLYIPSLYLDILLTPNSSIPFAGLSSLLIALKLPYPAPAHLPAWVSSPCCLGSHTLDQVAPLPRQALLSPLLGLWHPNLGTPLFPAGCPPHPSWLWHCMQGSPHPAVFRHPLVTHCVFPGHFSTDTSLALPPPNGFRTELFWKRKGAI